jgi:hypothetical protein
MRPSVSQGSPFAGRRPASRIECIFTNESYTATAPRRICEASGVAFNERGRAKIALGLARGKRKSDKREAEKARDWQRSRARIMREQGA